MSDESIHIEGYVRGMRTDAATSAMVLTVVIESEHKYKGLKLTDNLGFLYDITFTPKPLEEVEDEDEGDEISTGVGMPMWGDPNMKPSVDGGSQDGQQ